MAQILSRKIFSSSYLHSIIQLILVFQFIRMNPDPYHSGFVFAQAIGVADGLLPTLNFLSPYGIVGPIINGFWLSITSRSLLSLLSLYAIFIVIIGNLIRILTKKFSNEKTGLLLSYVWIFTLASSIPWPSILSTLLLLSGSMILLSPLRKENLSKTRILISTIVVVFLLDLAALTRIQMIVVPIAISIFLVFRRIELSSEFTRIWFLSNLLIGIGIVLTMQALGVLVPTIEQMVLWPSTFDRPPVTLAFISSFIWFPFAFLLFLILVTTDLFFLREKKVWAQRVSILIILIALGLLYQLSVMDFGGNNQATLRTSSGLLKNTAINMQFVICYLSGAFSLLGTIRLILRYHFKKSERRPAELAFSDTLMMILSFVGWIQLYPLNDHVHLWFVTPLFIVSAVYFIKRFESSILNKANSINRVLVCVLLIQFVSFFFYMKQDRVPLYSRELIGMQATAGFQSSSDQTMKLLGEVVKGRNLRNNCIAGLFAVSNRKFISIDGNFSGNFFGNFTQNVPVVDSNERIPKYIFECHVESEVIQNYLKSGHTVIFKVDIPEKDGKKSVYSNVLFESTIEKLE